LDKTEKINALKMLVAKGEYECARVVADDWDMTELLNDLQVTAYEFICGEMEEARDNVRLYADKNDTEMVIFWANVVQGYEKRIARMTIEEAEKVIK